MVHVADTASVDEFSKVRDNARVEEKAILEYSEVSGSAVLSGTASVGTFSVLRDNARVEGKLF